MSREAVETAVASAANDPKQKVHVEHCPRCRQVIKIPIQQLRRSLPPGWTPAGSAAETAPASAEAAGQAEPAVEAAEPSPADPALDQAPAPRRHHGRANTRQEVAEPADTDPSSPSGQSDAGQAAAGKPVAEAAPAKKTTRKQSKS